jgi:hypothetical protein
VEIYLKFNWLRFCIQHGVPYVDRGPNVKKGWINIKCPFCGPSDHSEHMGLDPNTSFWGCWRNQQHRGRYAAQLVSKLLGVSMAQAKALVGETGAPELETFDTIADQLKASLNTNEITKDNAVLKLYPEIRPLSGDYSARRFLDYLELERGFPRRDLLALAAEYNLCYATSGDFQDRIVLPFYAEDRLVTWIGRSIYQGAMLRYRDLEQERSILDPKNCLYNYDNARRGGTTLVLVEGGFDVLKLDFYGRPFGVRAVSRNTKSISMSQRSQLLQLRKRFDRVVNVLDTDDWASPAEAMQLTADLNEILGSVGQEVTPFQKKDPGALLPQEATAFARELAACQ